MKSFMSELLVGPIPRVPAKPKLPKGRDLRSSTNPLPLLTNRFLWALGKSKEVKEVKFSSPKPEEVYSVGLIGRRLGSRARGVAVVGTAQLHSWCHLNLTRWTEQPSVFTAQIPPGQPPSLLQPVLKVGVSFQSYKVAAS